MRQDLSSRSVVTFFPRNRLMAILQGIDRIRFAQHVRRAEAAIERLGPTQAAALSADIRAMAARCREDEASVFENCRPIGRAALRIIESARLAGRPGLAEAAEGIWEMVDALSSRGVWHTEALRIHADSLAVLSTLPTDGEDTRAIITELRLLRAAVGATSG